MTEMQDLIAKAATLLEALPSSQRFRSQAFVRYGGCFMDSPELSRRIQFSFAWTPS